MLDEVGNAAPAAGVDEDALVDDVVRAGANRVGGDARRAFPVAVVRVHYDHALAFCAQLLEVSPLVLLALPPDQVRLQIFDLGPNQLATRDCEPEPREVLTEKSFRCEGERRVRVGASARST